MLYLSILKSFNYFLKRFPILRNQSLKRKIIIVTILMVLIPMIITGAYFYRVISSIMTEEIVNKLHELTEQTSSVVNSQLENIDNTYFNLINDKAIRDNIVQIYDESSNSTAAVKTKSDTESRIRNFLFFNSAWNSKLINSVFLFLDEKNFYYYTRLTYSQSMLNPFIKVYQENKDIYKVFKLVPPNYGSQYIYYVRSFNNLRTASHEGTIILCIEEKMLSEIFESIYKYANAKAFLYDENGIIISNSDKALLGKKVPSQYLNINSKKRIEELTIDHEVYWVISDLIKGSNITSLIAIPKNTIFSELSVSIRNYMFIILIIIIVFLFVSILLSSKVTSHINDLITSMEKVQHGDYETRMKSYQESELIKLSSIFNSMTNQINHLINEVYQHQILIKEAELKSLHAQINPHFLFNVLLCIGWKAKMSNNETIHKMVATLSELLNSSIYSEQQKKIAIHEELKYVEFYLYLQKERHGDKISVDVSHIENNIKSYLVPKFSIQTIVENAIVHGLENKIGNGLLTIKGYEDNESIYIEITDDGIGFDTETISLNQEIITTPTKKNHSNIGLVNTNQRIKLLYGSEYGITIESEVNKGTRVLLHLPVDRGACNGL